MVRPRIASAGAQSELAPGRRFGLPSALPRKSNPSFPDVTPTAHPTEKKKRSSQNGRPLKNNSRSKQGWMDSARLSLDCKSTSRARAIVLERYYSANAIESRARTVGSMDSMSMTSCARTATCWRFAWCAAVPMALPDAHGKSHGDDSEMGDSRATSKFKSCLRSHNECLKQTAIDAGLWHYPLGSTWVT